MHRIKGVRSRSIAAKTVAGCFKFRNKIGFDVALEALRECVRQQEGDGRPDLAFCRDLSRGTSHAALLGVAAITLSAAVRAA